jgi:hypothetical protein
MDDSAGLYLDWETSRPGAAIDEELARVDRSTGQIEAMQALRGSIQSSAVADGSLFLTTGSEVGVTLLRLNPRTLRISGRWPVSPFSKSGGDEFGSVVVVGGGLWASGVGKLVRLALPSGRVIRRLTITGANSDDVATNPAGTILVATAANDGVAGEIQRRNPLTGQLLASSSPIQGITVTPMIGGVIDNGVWISYPGEMMGYVQRYELSTLTATTQCPEGSTTPTCLSGTNGISVRLVDGILWVSPLAGGPTRNYCANPDSGQVLASIPLPANDDEGQFLAAGADVLYISTQPGVLSEEPIPLACRNTS